MQEKREQEKQTQEVQVQKAQTQKAQTQKVQAADRKNEQTQQLFLQMQETTQVAEVLKTNSYTEKFGLTLTKQEALMLVKARGEALREQRRVEFGEGILSKLIFAFCDSDFMEQEHFAETQERLQEIFYLYKNESMDELTDDELISFMREKYDGECQGSLEYLEETVLNEFARKIRSSTRKYIGRYKK